MSVTIGYDAIWVNMSHLPAGAQWAGYSTGSGDVPWPMDWLDAHPGVLRYCQDAGATDAGADVLDVESGAATVADVPGWLNRARASWHAVSRPGQRWPAVYVNGSNIHLVANAVIAAKVATPVPLILANWSVGQAVAISEVSEASGPFPLHGMQISDPGPYDVDIYSTAWLQAVSRKPAAPLPAEITDGILVSHTMGWTGHRMKSADHGQAWTPVNP